jgi:hypothetical protein
MDVLTGLPRPSLRSLLAATAVLALAAPASAQDAPPAAPDRHDSGDRVPWAHARLPWYAPKALPYLEGMPIPPGYDVQTRRRRSLMIAGAALFGGSWLASVLTASTVVAGFDKHRAGVAPLFIPFAGPFVTLATSRDARLDDPARRANGALLLVDGATQIGGAALFIAGLVTREPILARTKESYGEKDKSALVPEVLVMGRAAALRWQF